MNPLQKSLIPLLSTAWEEWGKTPPPIIQEAELDLVGSLLTRSAHTVCGVAQSLISHQQLHRYVLMVFCPDEAFYPDAIRTYLQKKKIQPIKQHSILITPSDHKDLFETVPCLADQKNKLLLVYHCSAATTESMLEIERDIEHILAGVHQSTSDFMQMDASLQWVAQALSENDVGAGELLHWLLADHYLIFGLYYPHHPRKNLGLCKDSKRLSYLMPNLLEEIKAVPEHDQPSLHWLHLSATFPQMYSSTHVRALRICWFEKEKLKSVILLGHFSRGARYLNASQLPVFDGLWKEISKHAALRRSSFYQREVRMLFDRAPKSLLHSIPCNQWVVPFKKIVDMHTPTQVVVERMQPRHANFEYLLIAISQHRFSDNVWENMQQALQNLGVNIIGSEGYSVGTTYLMFAAVDAALWPEAEPLKQAIRDCVIFWKDYARQRLLQAKVAPEILHDALAELGGLSQGYQNQFSPEQFVADVLVRKQMATDGVSQVRLKLSNGFAQLHVEVQVLSVHLMPLAMMTEKLNAFSLTTMEQALVPFAHGEEKLNICKFRCEAPEMLHVEGLERLREGIAAVFNQSADHDPLNALVILAGLSISDVLVLISLRNHLAQLMPDVSIGALSHALVLYPQVSRQIFRLFEGKHRPSMPNTLFAKAKADFQVAMQDVQSLKEDTWLRALAAIVLASLRSNAWIRKQGQALAIKIDSSQLDFAPKPVPYREIFVHGIFVEGVHLRAGPIARGGLRYSDRPTDFRTEVLELMATQVVKNGQIVPTGAKGGFVIRGGEGGEFVLAQYHQFIHALLSITDNRDATKLVPPHGIRVEASDVDDAYLVVAADKGTARYSDDANAEALAVNFWLGDAFASGGSYGYDHKVFGITAKGAWACAEHHFSKFGVDVNQDTIRVVGIGDMGGDVFGNGMLLNPNLQLLAAFNHAHIFLDPTPDVAVSFVERKRLFDDVKGWGDYDTGKISAGGGVFARSSKSIQLSKQVQQALDVKETNLSGEALIRVILQAPVDLLYNGGIGTYIKASFQTHADAQDPVNNAVRVNANLLRCKVLSEGGNLGLTQEARIEYAQNNGIINTDAIDNAAGVNMSDHEVNLKILLNKQPFKRRNQWLLKVAEDVATQCLSDNKAQAFALSLAERTAQSQLPRLKHLQSTLFAQGFLESTLDNDELFHLRPVLSEWLGYEKNRVHEALDNLKFRQASMFGDIFLNGYFPMKLRKKFTQEILAHPLADDISHTRISSYILNRYGMVSIHYLENLTHSNIAAVVQSILIAEACLQANAVVLEKDVKTAADIDAWYGVQQKVLNFAEVILSLEDLFNVDSDWLSATQKGLRAFAKEQGVVLSDLTSLATAIVLTSQTGRSLKMCLHASQQCLLVLPFAHLEASLRIPLWAGQEAHALRNKWLGRLILLKIKAAKHLLEAKKGSGAVLKQWATQVKQAELTPELQHNVEHQSDEQRKLSVLLALTELENIIDVQNNQ